MKRALAAAAVFIGEKVEVEISRLEPFVVSLKKFGDRLGVEMAASSERSRCLMVRRIVEEVPGGALSALRKGDRILRVNQVEGSPADLLEAIRCPPTEKVELLVSRCPPELCTRGCERMRS